MIRVTHVQTELQDHLMWRESFSEEEAFEGGVKQRLPHIHLD